MSLPIYGSPFTLGMIDHKRERGLQKHAELRPVHDGDRIDIGPFDCEFLPVTHSIPSGNITAFHTSQGVILHSSDFKLDLTPVDGRRTDLSRIGALAHDPGIRLLMADSTCGFVWHFPLRDGGRSQSGLVDSWAGGRRVIVASFAVISIGFSNSPMPRSRTIGCWSRSGSRCAATSSWPGTSASCGFPTGRCATSKTSTNSIRKRPDRVHRLAGRAWGRAPRDGRLVRARVKLDDNDTVVFSSRRSRAMRLRSPPCATASARHGVRVFHSGWSISTPRDTASNRN